MSASKPGNRHRCPKCGTERTYAYAYDAFYCTACNLWLDEVCENKNCVLCSERSAKPVPGRK